MLLFGLSVLLLVSTDAEAGTNVGGLITTDTTWDLANSPYLVTSTVMVQGTNGTDGVTTLRIEPGVEVRFSLGTALEIGHSFQSSLPGALVASGTAAEPILFTSNQASGTQSAGFWGPIRFYTTASGALSTIENATIEFGGRSSASLQFVNQAPTLKHVTIRHGNTNGIQSSGTTVTLEGGVIHDIQATGIHLFSGNLHVHDSQIAAVGAHGASLAGTKYTFDNVTISGAGQYGIHTVSGVPDLRSVVIEDGGQRPLRVHPDSRLDDVTLSNNTIRHIEYIGGNIARDQVLPLRLDATTGGPYDHVFLGATTVRGTDGPDGITTLTMEPGIRVRFAIAANLDIGYFFGATKGRLVANGTMEQPILLTSLQAAGSQTRGFWGPLQFSATSANTGSILQNVTIEYGGRSSASLNLVSSQPNIRDVVIRESNTYGIQSSGVALDIERLMIDGVQNSGIHLWSGSLHLRDSTIHAVGGHGINLAGNAHTLRNVTIAAPAQYGIHTASGVAALTNVSIEGAGQRPLRLHPDSGFSGTELRNNTILQIELLGGNIARDQHLALWQDLVTGGVYDYVLLGLTTVRGTSGPDAITTLTIDPGVEVRFNLGASLDIGYFFGAPGALVASGTAAEPILFTSNQVAKTRGFWGPLQFSDTSVDATSRLENVTIEQGGRSTASLSLVNAAPLVRDVLIREGNTFGIQSSGSSLVFERLTVQGIQGTGIHLWSGNLDLRDSTIQGVGTHGVHLAGSTHAFDNVTIDGAAQYGVFTASGVTTFEATSIRDTQRPMRIHPDSRFADVTIAGSLIPEIEFTGGNIARDQVLPRWSDATTGARFHYVMLGTLTVRGNDGGDGVTSLTIEPGVTVRFGLGVSLDVGYFFGTQKGALIAQGTQADPILFTSNQPSGAKTRGYWGPLQFSQTSDDSLSTLANVTIEYGGRSSASLNLPDARPQIRDVVIREGNGHGIQSNGAGLQVERVLIAGVQLSGIHLWSGSSEVRDTTIAAVGLHGAYLGGSSHYFHNVTIDGTGQYGIHTVSGRAELIGTRINDTAGRPLRVTPDLAAPDLILENIGIAEIEILGATAGRDTTWALLRDETNDVSLPYVVLGDVTVLGKDGADLITTLTVDPGVEVRFTQWRSLNVGGSVIGHDPGRLLAVGTDEEPIRFTSHQVSKTPNHWGRIEFRRMATDSLVQHTIIEYAGHGGVGGIYLASGGATIRDNDIHSTGTYGIRTSQTPAGTAIEGNTFHNMSTALHLTAANGLYVLGNAANVTGDPIIMQALSASTIRDNRLTSTDGVLSLDAGSNDNLIYNNRLERSAGGSPVLDKGLRNRWHIAPTPGLNIVGGPWLAGNFYSDYFGVDYTNPTDGIGDTEVPHPIPGTTGRADPYPLVHTGGWLPDTRPPTTNLTIDAVAGQDGWFVSAPVLTLHAGDDYAGVARTLYRLDNGTETLYTDPFTVAADGNHSIEYRSEDRAGNVEATNHATLLVDRTPPDANLTLDVSMTDDLCFTLAASDATSGLAAVRWSILDASDEPVTNATGTRLENLSAGPDAYVCPALGADGSYRVTLRVADAAGHQVLVQTDLLALDLVGPILEVERPRHGDVYVGTTRIGAEGLDEHAAHAIVVLETEAVVHAHDPGSGIARGELWIDGVLTANATEAPFHWWIGPGLSMGEHTLTFRVYDNVGRVSEETRQILLVPAWP